MVMQKKSLFVVLLALSGMLFGMPTVNATSEGKKDRGPKCLDVKKLIACDATIGNLEADNLHAKTGFIEDLQANKLTVNSDAAIHGNLVVDGCVTSKCCKNTDQINPTIINVPFNQFYSTGTASLSGTTVTGVGTSFTPDMVGGRIVFNYQTAPLVSGSWANIVGFVDANHLIVDRSLEVASSTFRIG